DCGYEGIDGECEACRSPFLETKRGLTPTVNPRIQDRYCYNRSHKWPCPLYFGQFDLGPHSGIGPPSACAAGAEATTYAQANPTIRITILTARFMGLFSLACESPGSGNSHGQAL